MKKLVTAMILAAMLATLASCGNNGEPDKGTDGNIGSESVRDTEGSMPRDTLGDRDTSDSGIINDDSLADGSEPIDNGMIL